MGKLIKRIGTKENVASGTVINYTDMKDTGQFVAYYTDGSQQIGVKGDTLTSNATRLDYEFAQAKEYDIPTTPLQCFPNGTISIEPYLAKKYTITGTSITLDYPIIAIDSIKKLVNNEEQNVTDAILSADGLTISNITAGTYIVEGAIKPEYSTIPTTVFSYPKNTSAQTDGNTEMIGIHSQLLKELILASL